jgi:hypothetical protein
MIEHIRLDTGWEDSTCDKKYAVASEAGRLARVEGPAQARRRLAHDPHVHHHLGGGAQR